MDLLKKIKNNRYFILFVVLFAYVQSVHSRLSGYGELNIYIFAPDGAISTLITSSVLYFILGYFIQRWQKAAIVSPTQLIKIGALSLVVYLVMVQLIGLVIAIIFNNVERNFNRETFLRSTFTYLIDGFIYGSFFLSYYYYRKTRLQQEQLVTYNQALYNSRLTQLKSQLNPHFLFNNLNVLDQLIYEDKTKASDFLNEFSDIYRYVLQASNQTIVSIREELNFAQQYFNLMKHKFGNSYQLNVSVKEENGFIIPLTLQLLLENAIKHNLGSENNPVLIEVDIDDKITVFNNKISKRSSDERSGTGLSNLQEQYKMLIGAPVLIEEDNFGFSVQVPKLNNQ